MPRMPKYAKIGNKRDRLLQTQRDRSVHVIVRVINSALFIWFLSATCIAAGGSFFVQRQKCYADAKVLADQFYAIEDEFRSREGFYRYAVRRATTIDELIAEGKAYSSDWSEFNSKGFSELEVLRLRILENVDRPTEAIDSAINASLTDVTRYVEPLARSRTKETLSLESLKRLVAQVTTRDEDPKRLTLWVDSNCSFRSVASQLLSGENRALRAYLAPPVRPTIH